MHLYTSICTKVSTKLHIFFEFIQPSQLNLTGTLYAGQYADRNCLLTHSFSRCNVHGMINGVTPTRSVIRSLNLG